MAYNFSSRYPHFDDYTSLLLRNNSNLCEPSAPPAPPARSERSAPPAPPARSERSERSANSARSPYSEPLVHSGLLGPNHQIERCSSSNMKTIALIVLGIILLIFLIFIIYVIYLLLEDPISVIIPIRFGNIESFSNINNRGVLLDALTVSDFSSDGRYLAYARKDSNIVIYDLKNHDYLAIHSNRQSNFWDIPVNVRFIENDKFLVACTWEGVLRV